MKFLTWDVGILAALALLLAYSILIRRHKSLATLVSVYIAYFVAIAWGEQFAAILSGDRVFFNQFWIKANAAPYVIQTLLLVLFTFLISSFVKLGGKRSRYSTIEIIAYAVCTLAVSVMFILLFMPDETREAVLAGSRIAPFIYKWREWVMMVPVVAIIYFGIYGDQDV